MTGALNRKFGEQLLDLQFATAARSGRPLSLFFVDIDNFKSVNDQFGHESGDARLQRVAQSLRENLRRQDIVIRWGGDEFLVALPETDSANAEAAIVRIGGAGLGPRPDGVPQTASIGIAERVLDGADDWATLVDRADKRMYAAKHAGRNCYIGASGKTAPFIADLAMRERKDEDSDQHKVTSRDSAFLKNAIGAQLAAS